MFELREYFKPETLAEAIAYLSDNPGSKPIAGGTDILVKLREGSEGYSHVVDIMDLPELSGIAQGDSGELLIGANTTFTDLLGSDLIATQAPVLAQAAATVAGPQIRNVATLGGNICNGAPSADSAAPLLVLNARVELAGPNGARQLPLEKFYLGVSRVDLGPAEIMVRLVFPAEDHQGWSAAYFKYASREAMDIATIGCAAAVKVERQTLAELRLAYIVAGPTPLRCPTAEAAVKGMGIGPDMYARLQSTVLADLSPRDSWRGAKDFREHIIRTLARRVTAEAIEGAKGGGS